jgi:hypothetical protein
MRLCEVSSEYDVVCVCVQRVSDVYLLKHHELRIKLGYKVAISVEGRNRKVITFINSCNPWHRARK